MGSRVKEIESKFFTPRDYQLELLNYAVDHNTIVTLGTGSGKTFVAVLLIKEYALRLLENNEKAIFVVDKVALVEQQAAHIECHCSLSVGRMHGMLNSTWTEKEDFLNFVNQYHVLVVTAQVLVDLMNYAFFDLSTAALLIFDECHHALGKRHPFRLILDRYRGLPPEASARILGLTASVINKKVKLSQLEVTLGRLERIMCSRLEAVNDLTAVFKYGARPEQFVIQCRDASSTGSCIRDVLQKLSNFLDRNADFHPDFEVDPRPIVREAIEKTLGILDQLGMWCAWRTCSVYHKRIVQSIEEPTFGPKQKRLLKMAETTFWTGIKLLADQVGNVKSYEDLKPFVDSRLLRLLDILRFYEPSVREAAGLKDAMCALVFVKERFVAYSINLLLKHLAKVEPAAFGFLNPHFVVGHSGKYVDTDEASALSKQQDAVLQRFRSGALNLLVVTSVLEEGVDVRQCNLVIRFDAPPDFRSFVQSRGRARKENACFIILSYESEYSRLMEELSSYTQIEEFLLKYLKNDEVAINSGNDMTSVDEIIPPYIVERTGARVTMSSAISLVNRYCSKLPSDIFTRLVPQIRSFPVQCGSVCGYNAELIFPINSPIKETITLEQPRRIKSHALMAVALKACRILHERRELNDHLMPTGKSTVANLLHELDDEEYLPWRNSSSKKRRLYDRKMSRSVVGTLPDVGVECYLYVIEMKLTKPISEESNPKKRRILDPSDIEAAFGFLTKKILPPVPGFPVYQRQGEMEVHIRRARTMISVTENDMNLIQLFHRHIFDDILRVGRGGLEFAPEHSPMPLLIVPLRRVAATNFAQDYILDYRILSETIRTRPVIPTDDVRQHFKFDEATFLDAVVMPWYRCNDQFTYYYVADICRDRTPASAFPDEKFTSFNHYFQNKYQLEIFDQEQHLLDVDHTSGRMNLLLPRMSSLRTLKRSLDPAQRQVLVPELVHVHHLSASHWAMLIALPTIMYRLNSLLLADELRSIVVQEAFGEENAEFPEGFEWDVLRYPTAAGEGGNQPIKNLEQLKRIISAEERSKSDAAQLCATSKSAYMSDVGTDVDEDGMSERGFEISVWNPADAQEFVTNDVTSAAYQNGKRGGGAFGDEFISETMAMGGAGYSMHGGDAMSDDEMDPALGLGGAGHSATAMDEEYDILMDMKYSMHEKLAHLREPIEPRDGLDAAGWDDEELGTTNIGIDDTKCPLAVSGNIKEINVASLMRDLETNLGNVGPMSTTATKKSSSGTSVGGKGKRRGNNKSSKALADVLEAMDDDTPDRPLGSKHDGEFVNLLEFDDERIDRPASSNETQLNGNGAGSETNFTVINEEDESAKKAVDLSSHLIDISLVDEVHYEVNAPIVPGMGFSFDADLLSTRRFGVSPTLLLQALTTSSSADGINLERLETIGDSFLKLAVTNYLYHNHPDQHEGKLSFARSKEVSNRKLYTLGKRHQLPYLMEASKFDPHVNWLPPAYASNTEFHALDPAEFEEDDQKQQGELDNTLDVDESFAAEVGGEEVCIDENGTKNKEKKSKEENETGWGKANDGAQNYAVVNGVETITFNQNRQSSAATANDDEFHPLPHNMLTQQYVADKSVADAVEALIGAHLIYLGPRGALKFMNWLGVKVLTDTPPISSPLLRFIDSEDDPDKSRMQLYVLYRQFKFDDVEQSIKYRFGNKAYLVQAFTHASYYKNRITGCYQRLEFLGDAVLDYLITRFLFEHKKQYSPGVLTDLRSALVNNTIFASLAVKYDFHKHFIALCPGLYHMIEKFVNLCKSRGDSAHCTNFDDEMFMITEEDVDEGHEEDIEVPKALGDIFESIAGAVYLDCGMDLDVVWRVFYNLMKESIEQCCRNPPQSPVRELFERKNYKARFTKLERIIETGKVRVTVDVNEMRFVGMGRSYRIAKCTAAKRALQYLKGLEASAAVPTAAGSAKR